MKRTLPILSIAAVLIAAFTIMLTACGNKQAQPPSLTLSAADTAGLAQFQQWKTLNERNDPNLYYAGLPVAAAPVKRKVNRTAPAKKVTTTTTVPAATTKKKGWSKAAKGAVIGTATGAAAGAIINKKNRVLGGVIGGVIGGGVGYGIGRGMDKKDGRY